MNFQMVFRSRGDGRAMGNIAGVIILVSGGNLTGRDFYDYSNLFQSVKQHSVNIEHQLKPKLAWPMCT